MVTYVIRGKGTTAYAYGLWLLGAVILAGSWSSSGLKEALWALPAGAVAALIGYALFFQPRLEVNDLGIRVVNLLREWQIPWNQLSEVENRWGLYLHTQDLPRKISVWGVPSRAGVFDNSTRDVKSGGVQELSWNHAPGRYRRVMRLQHVTQALRDLQSEKAGAQPAQQAGSAASANTLGSTHMRLNTWGASALLATAVLVAYMALR